jgi:hypothetical protein
MYFHHFCQGRAHVLTCTSCTKARREDEKAIPLTAKPSALEAQKKAHGSMRNSILEGSVMIHHPVREWCTDCDDERLDPSVSLTRDGLLTSTEAKKAMCMEGGRSAVEGYETRTG